MNPSRLTAYADASGLWLVRRELRLHGSGVAWFVACMTFLPAVQA